MGGTPADSVSNAVSVEYMRSLQPESSRVCRSRAGRAALATCFFRRSGRSPPKVR